MKCVLFLVLDLIWLVVAQHNPYSLQAAVDALHRRETQLALRDYENEHMLNDPLYLNEAPEMSNELQKQQELNKLLARYLDREDENEHSSYEPDGDDDQYMDERKRSVFRERGDSPRPSVFREREFNQPDLAAEFVKEIDRERNFEREEKYRDSIRRLWEKYQQQENEIEEDLFDDEKPSTRMYGAASYVPPKNIKPSPPYFGSIVEKRRLHLPWLPATRRKRFPVAKRSPKYANMDASSSGTPDKVAKDLAEIFKEPITDEKKKRSSGDEPKTGATSTTTTTLSHKNDKNNDHQEQTKEQHSSKSHEHDHHNNHDVDHDGDLEEHAHEHEQEHDHDHDHEHEHDHEEDEDDDSDFDDEDDDDKKKKRAVKRSNPEILKEDQIIPGDLTDFKRKKSVQWSKYFGIDRRKKSTDDYFMNKFKYVPQVSRSHNQEARKNIELNEKKLESMDAKLKSIEDLIIDETIKYTGAHEGITNPEDVQRLKDHVISRLATAYSLEKMRRALDKLREADENARHLEYNQIEDLKKDSSNSDEGNSDKEKRVAVKKEKVQFDNNHHAIESATEKVVHDVSNSDAMELPEEDKKKKKKSVSEHSQQIDYNQLKHIGSAGPRSYPEYNDLTDFEEEIGAGHFEPMLQMYSASKGNQCPLLDAMEKRCRGIDLISGDIHQELLPICGVHQMCYLCGTSQTACDFQYLSEADSFCGHNKECQSAARSALMILRGSPGPQLGPTECARNSCLYRALRDMEGL